jgi:1,4-dihydroxy-2-naphthoyl-CoA hydrolase
VEYRSRGPLERRPSTLLCMLPDGPHPLAILATEQTFMGFLDAQFGEADPPGTLTCTVTVRDDMKQPMGIIHGGIYCAIAESVASMGAARAVGYDSGLAVMGQANNTSFLRPVTGGEIRATGTLRHRGRTTMVWHIDMVDSDDRLCALAQVTMAIRPIQPTA